MVTVQAVVVVVVAAVVVVAVAVVIVVGGGLQCSKKGKCIVEHVEHIVSGTMYHEMYCIMAKAYCFTPT